MDKTTRATGILTVMTLMSACATGYGTLASMGAGMMLGAVGAVSSASNGETGTARYVAQGVAAGALFGVVAAGVASLVAHHEARQEMAQERELEQFREWRRAQQQPTTAPQPAHFPTYRQPPAAAQEESVQAADKQPLPNPYPAPVTQ